MTYLQLKEGTNQVIFITKYISKAYETRDKTHEDLKRNGYFTEKYPDLSTNKNVNKILYFPETDTFELKIKEG